MKKTKQEIYTEAVENDDYKLVEKLVNDPEVNPIFLNHWAIFHATNNNFINTTKALLKCEIIDPTNDGINISIHKSFKKNNVEIFLMLFNDKRVREQLKQSDPILYDEYFRFYQVNRKLINF